MIFRVLPSLPADRTLVEAGSGATVPAPAAEADVGTGGAVPPAKVISQQRNQRRIYLI